MVLENTAAIKILIKGFFSKYLDLDGVTDIAYNGDGFINCKFHDGRKEAYKTDLIYEDALALAESVASARDQEINAVNPILSADLPGGERVQFNIHPSTGKGICAISIRIPPRVNFTMDNYVKQGMFKVVASKEKYISNTQKNLITLFESKQYDQFLIAAAKAKQTIIFAGATSTGKTTFARTLINYIPGDERLISIEDTKEIVFTKHKNSLNLYYPSNATSKSPLNSSILLKSCLRHNPDRILLTEMRDPDAYYSFIEAVKSGHKGSITSMHAGNVVEVFSKLVGMYLSSDAASKMPYDLVETEIRDLIDIVVCLERDDDTNKPYVSDIYFKEVDYEK